MSKLSIAEYTEEDDPDDPMDVMLEVLRSIEGLEELKLQKSLAKRLLTESRKEPLKFQLKQLVLEIYELDFVSEDINSDNMLEFTIADLAAFLASQKDSLMHLTIENAGGQVSDCNAMLRLGLLKYLEIGCCWFINEEELEQQTNGKIEKFLFRGFIDDDLRSIHEILTVYCSYHISKMKFLTDLTLESCEDLYSFQFPSLKTLTIIENGTPTSKGVLEIMHLVLLNSQLQRIIVPTVFRDSLSFDAFAVFNRVVEYPCQL